VGENRKHPRKKEKSTIYRLWHRRPRGDSGSLKSASMRGKRRHGEVPCRRFTVSREHPWYKTETVSHFDIGGKGRDDGGLGKHVLENTKCQPIFIMLRFMRFSGQGRIKGRRHQQTGHKKKKNKKYNNNLH